MNMNNIEKYRISGIKTTHMKLTKITIIENESLSMLERYTFDEEETLEILREVQKNMEMLNLEREQKEYEEMNYMAICKRMYRYSIFELFKQLISSILLYSKIPKILDKE